jgi:hypothetical protein
MAWFDLVAALNHVAAATFGEPVIFAHGATTTALTAVISKSHDPFMVDGSLTFSQHHYQGMIEMPSLAGEPVIGDTLTTAAGVVYVIDQPPAHADGLYSLILRRRP